MTIIRQDNNKRSTLKNKLKSMFLFSVSHNLRYLMKVWLAVLALVRHGKAPAKRSQHANTTYHNIAGPNILLLRCVATCWVLLVQIWPFSNLANNTLHVAPHRNTVAKRNMFGPKMLWYVCWHVAIVWPGPKMPQSRTWKFFLRRKLLTIFVRVMREKKVTSTSGTIVIWFCRDLVLPWKFILQI